MQYIRNHWRGDQSLFQAFWINLLALRIAILYFEQFTHPPFSGQTTAAIVATIGFFIVFHLIVFAWQVTGLLRACDRYIGEHGSYTMVWAAQLGTVACLLFTVVYALAAFQSLYGEANVKLVKTLMTGPELSPYHLRVSDNETRIHVQGDFKIGITRELTALLARYPGVRGIILSSDGGKVTEGRGVARLIRDKGLDTYVFDSCKSACATAFVGGVRRILGAGGRLGFHQYQLQYDNKPSYFKPQVEQQIDLEFYREQSIDRVFLEKVFQASQNNIWFPGADELLAAGVVHKVLGKP